VCSETAYVVAKFLDGLSLHRLEKMFQRIGAWSFR
jgi:hypothetical protein